MQILCSARWWPSITWDARHRIAWHTKSYVQDNNQQNTGKKVDLQTKCVADSWNCKTNKAQQAKPD